GLPRRLRRRQARELAVQAVLRARRYVFAGFPHDRRQRRQNLPGALSVLGLTETALEPLDLAVEVFGRRKPVLALLLERLEDDVAHLRGHAAFRVRLREGNRGHEEETAELLPRPHSRQGPFPGHPP